VKLLKLKTLSMFHHIEIDHITDTCSWSISAVVITWGLEQLVCMVGGFVL
jgi:hypothetical protein